MSGRCSERSVWRNGPWSAALGRAVMILSIGAGTVCGGEPRSGQEPQWRSDLEVSQVLVGPIGPVDPLLTLIGFLAEMEDGLLGSITGTGSIELQAGEPFLLQTNPELRAEMELWIVDAGIFLVGGTVTVVPDAGQQTVDLSVVITEAGITRTLNQHLSLAESVLTVSGSLTIEDAVGTTTLLGGWIYSLDGGGLELPNSDAGFHDEVTTMFHFAGGSNVAGFGFLSNALSIISNVVSLAIHYIVDVFIQYEPPESCLGPIIFNNSGQSCDGVDIPCADDLAEMCLAIADLPESSNAFKQCMRGRCGCGGSSFSRAGVSCSTSDDCGPCAQAAQGSSTVGCSLSGTRIWYCYDEPPFECACSMTIFHEMSHGCGALDLSNGGPLDADRIGDWFESECIAVSINRR